MSLEDNKTIPLELFNAIGDRNLERVANVLADDGVFWVIGTLPFSGSIGKKQLLGNIQQLFDTMKGGITMHMDNVTAEEDRVSMTGVGEMVTTEGVPYCNTYNWMFKIRNGQIILMREYFDTQLTARVFNFTETA